MIPSHLQYINKCVIFYLGATRIAVRLNFSYIKKKQLHLVVAVASFVLITVTTMLIVSNNVLTFRMYFPHTNISFLKGACMTSHTVQKANRYPLSIAPGYKPIIIISIEHTFVNIIMTIADSFLHHFLKTLPKAQVIQFGTFLRSF